MNSASPPTPALAWGVGMGYRACIHHEIMSSAPHLDFLEIPAEDYVDAYRRKYNDPDEILLQEAARDFPVVGHGSDVSVGSAEPASTDYLERVVKFSRRYPISEYSEHLTCTRAGAELSPCFIAIPFTDLGVAACVANSRRIAGLVGLPFQLENVCYHFPIPHAGMREEEFLTRVVEEVDCGILLDVTNVFINAHNHKYDAHEFIRGLPPERIWHGHYCGVLHGPEGVLLDTHSEITPRPVWDLVDFVLRHTEMRALILERDDKFIPWQKTQRELELAREIFLKHRPASAPSTLSAPTPKTSAPFDSDDYSRELALFQQVLFRTMIEDDLRAALEKEGASALVHTGLGKDEREILAAVPQAKREFVGKSIQAARLHADKLRDERRTQELKAWGTV